MRVQHSALHGRISVRENAYHQLHYVQFTQRRPYLDFLNSWFFETLTEHSALVAGNNSDFIGAFRERLAVIVRNRARSSYPADHGVVLPEAARREDRFLGLHRRGKDNSRAIAGWARGGRFDKTATAVYTLYPGRGYPATWRRCRLRPNASLGFAKAYRRRHISGANPHCRIVGSE